MKHRILAAALALLFIASFSAGAQNVRPARPGHHHGEGAFRGIGLTFGYVNSSYRTVDLATDEPVSSGLLHGFTAGLTKDFTLLPHALYFQTGLNYIYQNDPRNETVKVPAIDLAIRVVGPPSETHSLSSARTSPRT